MEGLVHSKEGLISIARHSLFCFPEYQQDQRFNIPTFIFFRSSFRNYKKKDSGNLIE